VKDKIKLVKNRMVHAAKACTRDPETIRLVAVSKTIPAEKVRSAINAGLFIFGENYIQEAADKIVAINEKSVSWHFIGHLQSNKAKYAVKYFDLIHSVDSLKLARELNKHAAQINKTQDILVQVNISMEESKSGVSTEDTIALIKSICLLENLSVKGLMTIPPYYNEPEKSRPFFKSLAALKELIFIEEIPGVELKELSMGMTGDFEVAIEEGATLVRIGTAIFGERI